MLTLLLLAWIMFSSLKDIERVISKVQTKIEMRISDVKDEIMKLKVDLHSGCVKTNPDCLKCDATNYIKIMEYQIENRIDLLKKESKNDLQQIEHSIQQFIDRYDFDFLPDVEKIKKDFVSINSNINEVKNNIKNNLDELKVDLEFSIDRLKTNVNSNIYNQETFKRHINTSLNSVIRNTIEIIDRFTGVPRPNIDLHGRYTITDIRIIIKELKSSNVKIISAQIGENLDNFKSSFEHHLIDFKLSSMNDIDIGETL